MLKTVKIRDLITESYTKTTKDFCWERAKDLICEELEEGNQVMVLFSPKEGVQVLKRKIKPSESQR